MENLMLMCMRETLKDRQRIQLYELLPVSARRFGKRFW